MPDKREIWFHEDNCCQQELLPSEVASFVDAELKKCSEFAEAHRAPGGIGWTDVYLIKEAPVQLSARKISKEELDQLFSGFFPRFDAVFTGYSSHSEPCRRTAAWGRSTQCALFAGWDEAGIVSSIWGELFERDEESVRAAADAVAAVGRRYRLLYVDWAWEYACDASDPVAFASMLRSKLEVIASRRERSEDA